MKDLNEYRTAAELIYPGMGAWAYDRFDEYNARYFDGGVPLVPIQWHLTLPHGHATERQRIQLGLYTQHGKMLEDGVPTDYASHVILHEMIHTYLNSRGENPNHNGKPWSREITRISGLMGFEIIAQPDRVSKVRDGDGNRRSVRVPAAEGSLTRKQIAAWPHSILVDQK